MIIILDVYKGILIMFSKKNLSDLIDVEFLQEFQDAFALAADIASVIIDESGQVTKPSNFTDFCTKYAKSIDLKGKCSGCNIKWEKNFSKTNEPIIYKCHFGLTNFIVPIIVDGQHIASILGGQVFIKKPDEIKFRELAKQIGIDEKDYIESINKIKIVTLENAKATANLLQNMANSISKIINKNLELIKKNEREVLAKKVIESVRSSLNIEETLEISTYVLAKSFDIDRVVVVEFFNKNNLQDFNIRKEYKIKKTIKSPQEIEGYKKIGEFAGVQFSKSPKPLVIDNISKSKYPKFFKDFYKHIGIKSLLWFPIMLKGQLWGAFTLSNIFSYKHWSNEDINIIEDIANQISIAINQAQLYTKKKEFAEREALLREAIQIFRSTTDSEKIKKYFLEIIGNYFDADRCLFCDYDKETKKFLPFKIERLKSPDIKSLVGFDVEKNTPEFAKRMQNRKNVIIKDLEKTLSRLNKASKKYKALSSMHEFGVKSDYGLFVEYKGSLIGVLIIHFVKEKRILTNKELDFLGVLKNQVGTALYQAELFKENKQVAENEKVLRRIMLSLASTFDFQEIIISIVTEAGKFFKADRCFYVEIDRETSSNLEIKDWAEYLSSPKIKSHLLIPSNKYETVVFIEQTLNKKIILCSDTEKEDLPKATKKMLIDELSVKSYFILPVYSGDFVYGSLVFHYVNDFKTFTQNDLYMAEAIVNQVSIAINQSGLYQKQKYNAEKEKLLRDVIDTVRNSIDIDEIENKFVTEMGKRFKADRVFISRFNSENNTFLPVPKTSEYLSDSNVKSIANIEIDKFKGYGDIFRNKQIINFSDYKEFIKEYKGKIDENFLYEYDIKSGFALPLSYMDKICGVIVIQYTKNYHVFNEEEISLIKIIADQVGVALSQAKLFKENKQVAENESALRQIMLSSVATFNYEQIVNTIVKQAGEFFKADRCFYIEIEKETSSNLPIKGWAEYLSSPKIKSHLSKMPSKEKTGVFAQLSLQKKIVFCDDIEKEDIPEETKKMLKALSVKSYLFAPVYYGDIVYGALVLHFVRDFKQFTQSDHYMIQAIANQSAIIINQSEIYKKQKNTAERETLLRTITEIIRGSLDIEETLSFICEETAKLFNVQRTAITSFPNPENHEIFIVRKEYKAWNSMEGFGLRAESPKTAAYWANILIEGGLIMAFDNLETSNAPDYFKDLYISMGIKSIIGTSIKKGTDVWGTLILAEYNNYRHWTEEEKVLLKTIADQIYIAINQSELYEKEKKTAYKESVLREIISEIKLTRDLHQAYDTLLNKLAQIFDLNRTLFLESSEINPEELNIKYEYVLEREDLATNNLIFPQVCIEEFLNLIHNLQPLILNDVSLCYPEETTDFFEKYKIQALLSFPLIKYNKEIKVLGFIVLCSEHTRKWTDEEIELMKAISDSVVSVIWEIAKFIETEELRNSFVSTLAHDFQVPLIGESVALEYMLKYSETELGENREIIKELYENNQNIIDLLNKSVNIYNYESGKKNLYLIPYKISKILNEAIILSKSFANSKKIKINFQVSQEPRFIEADKKELLKVFNILIENAVKHSPSNNEIQIKYYKKSSRVIISIHNPGKFIPLEIQEKIFNRYEMAQAIERKIGAGTGLFLAKRIVEAHKGAIWFDTNKISGTTFYVALPEYMDKS